MPLDPFEMRMRDRGDSVNEEDFEVDEEGFLNI